MRSQHKVRRKNPLLACRVLAALAFALGEVHADPPAALSSAVPVQWGAYLDLSFPVNFNASGPHRWRSKLTTNRLNQLSPNLGALYFRKEASPATPWGLEIGTQGGYDTDDLVPTTHQLPGADVLRYLTCANVSYRAPVGRGLVLTGGLMNSFIGFESFYARDNPNYTRSWIADYSPYFLIGAGGRYPVSDNVSTALFVVSDYNYLQHQNNHPKYAAQVTWNFRRDFELKQNVFVGPEQQETDLSRWRFFSDTQLIWSNERHRIALAYDIGTERSADPTNPVQTLWTGAALFTHWRVHGPWSLGLRPELYYDPNGNLTGSIQFIKAITATVEYAIEEAGWKTQLRAEFRYDNSTGRQGGFYGAAGPDGPLVSGQASLFFAVMTSYDRF